MITHQVAIEVGREVGLPATMIERLGRSRSRRERMRVLTEREQYGLRTDLLATCIATIARVRAAAAFKSRLRSGAGHDGSGRLFRCRVPSALSLRGRMLTLVYDRIR